MHKNKVQNFLDLTKHHYALNRHAQMRKNSKPVQNQDNSDLEQFLSIKKVEAAPVLVNNGNMQNIIDSIINDKDEEK